MNSPINITLNLPPVEFPPIPSVVIPYSRDACFVDRSATFYEICQKCAVPGSQTALVGLSGVGKSYLAIEYAFRTHERSPGTWVFWVIASNAARFEQSFRDIADYVRIRGRRNPRNDIFQLVYCWLWESKEKWILIFDDLRDVGLLNANANKEGCLANDLETTTIKPHGHRFHCERGSVLFTMRDKEEARKTVQQCGIINVGPMDKAQAFLLFEKKLGSQMSRNDVAELVAALRYIPLAIAQAAAHISQRASYYSVRHYLEKIKWYNHETAASHDGSQRTQTRELKNCLINTWKISFDYIRKIQPSTTNLLSFMSFFDRQGIPAVLLRSQNGRSKEEHPDDKEYGSSASSTNSDRLREDLAMLRNYCFISVNADGTTCEMYAIVRLMTRKWLQANNEFDRWNQQFIYHLNAKFPAGEHQNWQVCQAFFAHAMSAAYQKPEGWQSLAEWATLMYHAAWYALAKGSATDAEKLAAKSVKARRMALGESHKYTLNSVEMLGLAYNLRGRWGPAEELLRQVMEMRRTILGERHPETLTSMNNIAFTLDSKAYLSTAIALMERCCQLREAVLGPRHSSTISSLQALGVWRAKRVHPDSRG
ncbi:hypothetical protein BS50DRAFT_595122 [Corynespora cassiicola Philippines]|uniref:NB-ARC domain-containing protein n=1 Tax=Corynespora cassiicola Philippines TaxID=1448308 RepID=A0A2T2N0A8_CORCC|nr:hypothetical protein BS50DRAFT_595122 [Corynespora cassiicola Philippines]